MKEYFNLKKKKTKKNWDGIKRGEQHVAQV